MYDAELETMNSLAKSAPTSKPRSFWYGEIQKHANRRRKDGQSLSSAVAAFIQDSDGAPLFKAMNAANGPALAAPPDDDDPGGGESEALTTLRTIAALLMREDPSLSKSAALAKALTTEAGARAYLADRRARLRAA